MPTLNLEKAATVRLPAIEAKPVRRPIGRIRHIIRPPTIAEFVDVQECQVSVRRAEQLAHLSSGEKILFTERRTCPFPEGTDGVVLVEADGNLSWLHHKTKTEFDEKIERDEWAALRKTISDSWIDGVRFRAEELNADGSVAIPGLRPAQIGALHAIGAHWSLHRRPATVVMPTGTGKTETMLAANLAYARGPFLVVVPWNTLRDQTVRKFLSSGLLRDLGIIAPTVRNPIVGIIEKRPKTLDELAIFEQCHVVVCTMSCLGQGTASTFARTIADRVDALVVDEAHHVPARSWHAFRDAFASSRVLQFTATPFRRDGQVVDGDVIYSYPLGRAQKDGYFKPIRFEPVFEIDPKEGDRAIVRAAVEKLREDLVAGRNHLLMARCETIERAEEIHRLYASAAPDFHPEVVHSDQPGARAVVGRLQRGECRIVVCVDMLGEGFDLPELKIAAVHDTHKSLAILLQFTGRFTRTAAANIGDATVIANIADVQVSAALERLYSEDADWNQLLSEFSSTAVREHAQLVEFLMQSTRLDSETDFELRRVSPTLLRPKFSAVVYRCTKFTPKAFFRGITAAGSVRAVWLHEPSHTLYFVTCTEPAVAWSRSKEVKDRQWDLFVLHYDPRLQLLYLHSSDKSSLHDGVAKAVGGEEIELIHGDNVFRTLGNIRRLVFQQIGVRKIGRRNLRFAMYTGADVKQALSQTERAGSVKSNLSGSGFEEGRPVTIGCSYKGRVWSKEFGPIRKFIDWCAVVGGKLADSGIDTTQIIDNVLIPEDVERLPGTMVLSIDWPIELLRQSDERVTLTDATGERSLSLFEIDVDEFVAGGTQVSFRIARESGVSQYNLTLGGSLGFSVTQTAGPSLRLKVGRLEMPVEQYLGEYPPLVRFIDLSELDGNLLVKPQTLPALSFPSDRLEPWDWTGIDITKESMWKDGERRPSSIQEKAAVHFQDGHFDIVFDDDASGEAADLVCIKEEDEYIRLALVHCKFSGRARVGERVKDVVEVCSQAVRSTKWIWKFKDLCRHVVLREGQLRRTDRPTRFLSGTLHDVNRMVRTSRFKPIKAEIVIVQPGISQRNCTPEQAAVLAGASGFIKQTVDIDLDVICSG